MTYYVCSDYVSIRIRNHNHDCQPSHSEIKRNPTTIVEKLRLQQAISELPSASVSNRVQVRNLSYENEYDLHSNGLVSKTHFHMKGFALGLVLKQRQKRTRKWPTSQA